MEKFFNFNRCFDFLFSVCAFGLSEMFYVCPMDCVTARELGHIG